MAEQPKDAKLSDLMRPPGKPKIKNKKKFAKSYREAKENCG